MIEREWGGDENIIWLAFISEYVCLHVKLANPYDDLFRDISVSSTPTEGTCDLYCNCSEQTFFKGFCEKAHNFGVITLGHDDLVYTSKASRSFVYSLSLNAWYDWYSGTRSVSSDRSHLFNKIGHGEIQTRVS